MGMTQQTTNCARAQRADVASSRDAIERANIDAGWRRFRDELDARLVDRFGVAFRNGDGSAPDPDVLADLALQRALMP
jgi:hypothetical protein